MNTRTMHLMAFFSLFFITAQCCFNDFTLEHFEIIYNSQNGDFVRSESFTGDQKKVILFFHEDGNLIKIMQRYYGLNGDVSKAGAILGNILKIGVIDTGYTALNNSLADTRIYHLNLLKNYINQETKDLERLTEPAFVESLNHSTLVDEFGNTGLILAAQTGNKKVFKNFLQAYINQKCPLHSKNTQGLSVYDFADKSTINEIAKQTVEKIKANKQKQSNCLIM